MRGKNYFCAKIYLRTKIRNLAILVSHFALKVRYSHHFPSFSPKGLRPIFTTAINFLFWLCMEVSQGPDFSGDPFCCGKNGLTLTSLKNPASRKQNRGARGARRNSNFSCISDMLASGAEGPLGVLGDHKCTG